jgi:hypothetical protein
VEKSPSIRRHALMLEQRVAVVEVVEQQQEVVLE